MFAVRGGCGAWANVVCDDQEVIVDDRCEGKNLVGNPFVDALVNQRKGIVDRC